MLQRGEETVPRRPGPGSPVQKIGLQTGRDHPTSGVLVASRNAQAQKAAREVMVKENLSRKKSEVLVWTIQGQWREIFKSKLTRRHQGVLRPNRRFGLGA